MQIHLQVHGFVLTDALDQHARRRLRFALDRLADSIDAVVVRLSSENDGRRSRCQLQVQLRRCPDVLIEETRDDLYVAIDKAADRAAESVTRRMGRARQQLMRSAPVLTDAPRLRAETGSPAVRR